MAKVSMVEREKKREKLVLKYKDRRDALRNIMKSHKSSAEEKQKAMFALQKQPRDASPSRKQHRCAVTGRPHGVYSRYKLARTELRRVAMQGFVPGLHKASW